MIFDTGQPLYYIGNRTLKDKGRQLELTAFVGMFVKTLVGLYKHTLK